ncbi:MAG: transcriptional regulator [Pseudomonas sp.]|nr:transcriptional regulator [Pseudomonas sp.]
MISIRYDVGRLIKEKRVESGMTQEAFALLAKVDRSYMGRIERGKANISIELLYKLAFVLKCEVYELLPNSTIDSID